MPHRSRNLPSALISAIRKEPPRFRNGDTDRACTTIASYNVHKCVGADGKFDPGRVTAVISELNADIVALQEADERFGERAGLLDLRGLERNFELVAVLPPTKSHGWHGNVLLAKQSVVQHIRRLSLPGVEPRGAIVADLELKGVRLRIIAAHLGLLRRSRSLQAQTLLEAAHSQRPTILLGDLNEWRVRRRSSLMPLIAHFGPIDAVLPSFPSRFPLFALDRILARPSSLIVNIEIHDTPLARVASDHLPIKARLDLSMVGSE